MRGGVSRRGGVAGGGRQPPARTIRAARASRCRRIPPRAVCLLPHPDGAARLDRPGSHTERTRPAPTRATTNGRLADGAPAPTRRRCRRIDDALVWLSPAGGSARPGRLSSDLLAIRAPGENAGGHALARV